MSVTNINSLCIYGFIGNYIYIYVFIYALFLLSYINLVFVSTFYYWTTHVVFKLDKYTANIYNVYKYSYRLYICTNKIIYLHVFWVCGKGGKYMWGGFSRVLCPTQYVWFCL